MNVTELAPEAKSNEPAERANLNGALEDAFARYQSELLGTLYYCVGNVEDARDALQESFIKCWRHRDKLSEVQNLKAWIFRIAINTGRDIRETAWRRKRKSMPEENAMITTKTLAADSQIEQTECLSLIRSALRDLRQEEQEVFLLRQNGDMTYEEIADTVGIPVGTVKTRMRLALAKLRTALANR